MLKVVKIGGNIVDNPEKLDSFLRDFSTLSGPKVLVHGGGKVATTISKALGIETVMIHGRRVTDDRTRDVVTMVYAGLINKTIVNKLNAAGCNSVGLCGADGMLITSKKRPPVMVDGSEIDFGFVGDPYKVNAGLLSTMEREGYTVVVAPITTDGEGSLLNTNADTVAATLARALASDGEVELIYCFEKPGVLLDSEDDSSVISLIDKACYARLKAEGAVFAGMIPKLDNAFEAIDAGVKSVVICAAENIAADGYGGTIVKA